MEQRHNVCNKLELYSFEPFAILSLRQFWRWIWAFLLIGLFNYGIVNACFAGQNQLQHVNTKANYLVKLPRYVQWPHSSGTITFCVIGSNPFGNALDNLIKGKTQQGRKFTTRYLGSNENPVGCEILFISPQLNNDNVEAVIRRSGKGILTVSDHADFIQQGGMIEFVDVGKQVKFRINAQKAVKKGLKISSELIKLGIK